MTAYQEKLRRLAAKGMIKTPESHPEEYAAYLDESATLLRQLQEIAKEYMGEHLEEDDPAEASTEDDYSEESFA